MCVCVKCIEVRVFVGVCVLRVTWIMRLTWTMQNDMDHEASLDHAKRSAWVLLGVAWQYDVFQSVSSRHVCE